jgi:MYXO-CTERM domain-containing protein
MARSLKATVGISALALGTLLTTPESASACGGFFCDSSQPVNQSAERIIFTHDAAGAVTAVIQIQYAGPADRFAWVLPVAGSPEVDVSSNAAFQRLQQATNPQYLLTTRVEGTCRDDGFRGFPSGAVADASAASDGGASLPPVTVVDSGAVGPYDYVVISIDPAALPLSSVAVDWLTENGFAIDEAGAALLEPYLAGGMNLLAFRLTSGNDVGSIRPVTITFGPGLASIPIRPTAVATVENMGVLVWVLGEERSIPVNYLSLELNESLINWLNPGPTYGDVVNAAADEAGGQGFVTEMAGATTTLGETIFSSFEREQWSTISATTWTDREGELLASVLGQFGGMDGMRDAIAATLPLPADVTIEALLSCVSCYYPTSETDIAGFDPAAFLGSVETNVIEPMERARGLFDAQPYVTRFYTTMSAAEMTRDPSFDFNGNLPDVSNVHNAERVIECSPSISQADAPWRVLLPGGESVRGTGTAWPLTVGTEGMPANARILRVGTEGEGVVIEDNVAVIASALTEHNATIPAAPRAQSGGCSAGTSGSRAPIFAMLALAALATARRRRQR